MYSAKNNLPVTVRKTIKKTATVKTTNTVYKTVTVRRAARRSDNKKDVEQVEEHVIETRSDEPSIDASEFSLDSDHVSQSSHDMVIFKRHLCPVCPSGATVIKSGPKNNDDIKYCCPARKTVTKTTTKLIKATVKVYKTITQTAVSYRVQGTLYTDSSFTVPLANRTVALVTGGIKARALTILAKNVTKSDGSFVLQASGVPLTATVTLVDQSSGQAIKKIDAPGTTDVGKQYAPSVITTTLAAKKSTTVVAGQTTTKAVGAVSTTSAANKTPSGSTTNAPPQGATTNGQATTTAAAGPTTSSKPITATPLPELTTGESTSITETQTPTTTWTQTPSITSSVRITFCRVQRTPRSMESESYSSWFSYGFQATATTTATPVLLVQFLFNNTKDYDFAQPTFTNVSTDFNQVSGSSIGNDGLGFVVLRTNPFSRNTSAVNTTSYWALHLESTTPFSPVMLKYLVGKGDSSDPRGYYTRCLFYCSHCRLRRFSVPSLAFFGSPSSSSRPVGFSSVKFVSEVPSQLANNSKLLLCFKPSASVPWKMEGILVSQDKVLPQALQQSIHLQKRLEKLSEYFSGRNLRANRSVQRTSLVPSSRRGLPPKLSPFMKKNSLALGPNTEIDRIFNVFSTNAFVV